MATFDERGIGTDAPPPKATLKVRRRTFAAKKFPEGSQERAILNLHTSTSEYMTSYRYYIEEPDGFCKSFRTKGEAEKWKEQRS